MKFCHNCGAEIKDNAKFCPKCGSSLNTGTNLKEANRANINSSSANSGGSKNVLIIAVALVICVAIIAGAFIIMSNNDSPDVVVVNASVDDNGSVEETSSSSSSSSSSDYLTYSDALNMYSGSSSNIISNAFYEADSNGDGLLTGSEISEFKRLADLAVETASESNSDTKNEHGSITRYCTTHGRVTTGEDLKCPYCEAEGLDSRTVKGSTEYN